MGFYAIGIVIAWLLMSIGDKLKKVIANSNEIVNSLDLMRQEISSVASDVNLAAADLSAIKAKVKMIEAVALGMDRAGSDSLMDDYS